MPRWARRALIIVATIAAVVLGSLGITAVLAAPARVEKKASVSKTLRVADKVAKRNAELLRRLA